MKEWSRFLRTGGVCLLGAAVATGGERRAAVRVYTDQDLARVSSRRGETGVLSEPPAAPPAESLPAAGSTETRREPYWRSEAARVRQRVEPWRDAAADLRVEISARRSEPGVRPYTDPKVRAMQRRLEALDARIRDAEDRLEERARRAGALPGWLR